MLFASAIAARGRRLAAGGNRRPSRANEKKPGRMIDPDVTALAEQVASPLLQRLLQEWDARRRGRRMPARADFQPEALRFILGSLILFDVLAEPLRFRYRLVGTNLTWRRGVDLTGGLLDEHPDQRLREEAVPVCRIVVDTRRPYRVYGGLQDNGSWGGPSQTLRPSGPTNADYQFIQGGDGFVCRVDPNDPDIVYSESQGGNMFRRNLRTGEGKSIRPKIQAGAGKYRFNWNTPFILSSHNSHIFYAAGNYVFRSVKQGDDLRIFSPEITRTKHGSATALSESPKNPDVLWVGADDGAVWMTRDGGKNWTDLTGKLVQLFNRGNPSPLPGPRWVSSIEASRVAAGRCYIVFDGHRSDDDEPYVFVTEDYGETWRSLRANLPIGSTRVLREDLYNPDVLYLGTEFALYASLTRGAAWFRINGNALPTVAIHETAQPTTANEIVAATHGRSIWVLDVTTLRQLKPAHLALLAAAKDVKGELFTPTTATRWQLDFTREGMFRTGTRHFVGTNPPRGAVIDYLLFAKTDKLSLRVVGPDGGFVRDFDLGKEKDAGFHRVVWDLVAGGEPKGGKDKTSFTPYGQPVKPGVYRVQLTIDGVTHSRLLTVEADPRLGRPGSTINETEELRKLLKERP
ncbi:MAG: PAS domain-containing protein [Planctomycetes bacterium]|nr:PAS domain-containing protein [Planctomycetota bacterium]